MLSVEHRQIRSSIFCMKISTNIHALECTFQRDRAKCGAIVFSPPLGKSLNFVENVEGLSSVHTTSVAPRDSPRPLNQPSGNFTLLHWSRELVRYQISTLGLDIAIGIRRGDTLGGSRWTSLHGTQGTLRADDVCLVSWCNRGSTKPSISQLESIHIFYKRLCWSKVVSTELKGSWKMGPVARNGLVRKVWRFPKSVSILLEIVQLQQQRKIRCSLCL